MQTWGTESDSPLCRCQLSGLMTVIHPSLMPCKTQAKAANELMKRVGRVGVSHTLRQGTVQRGRAGVLGVRAPAPEAICPSI